MLIILGYPEQSKGELQHGYVDQTVWQRHLQLLCSSGNDDWCCLLFTLTWSIPGFLWWTRSSIPRMCRELLSSWWEMHNTATGTIYHCDLDQDRITPKYCIYSNCRLRPCHVPTQYRQLTVKWFAKDLRLETFNFYNPLPYVWIDLDSTIYLHWSNYFNVSNNHCHCFRQWQLLRERNLWTWRWNSATVMKISAILNSMEQMPFTTGESWAYWW